MRSGKAGCRTERGNPPPPGCRTLCRIPAGPAMMTTALPRGCFAWRPQDHRLPCKAAKTSLPWMRAAGRMLRQRRQLAGSRKLQGRAERRETSNGSEKQICFAVRRASGLTCWEVPTFRGVTFRWDPRTFENNNTNTNTNTKTKTKTNKNKNTGCSVPKRTRMCHNEIRFVAPRQQPQSSPHSVNGGPSSKRFGPRAPNFGRNSKTHTVLSHLWAFLTRAGIPNTPATHNRRHTV